jgi:C4-dicarboxylate-binding protein DctP
LEDNEEAIAKVKASGRSTVYAHRRGAGGWRQALLSVHRDIEGRIGRPLIDALYREAAALGYKMAR